MQFWTLFFLKIQNRKSAYLVSLDYEIIPGLFRLAIQGIVLKHVNCPYSCLDHEFQAVITGHDGNKGICPLAREAEFCAL